MRRRDVLALSASAAPWLLPWARQASAQGSAAPWPSRPLTLVAPLAAGSSVDIISRIIAENIGRTLGQPVVVENRPSANGNLAMEQVSRMPADGYAIITMGQTSVAFNPYLYANLRFDPLKDFAFITRLVAVSNVLVVKQSSPIKSVAELIATAKAQPGRLTFSSGGVGSTHHISSAMLAQMAGLDMVHVPYRGAPQGILAVESGEVDFAYYNISTLLPAIQGGRLRALAVTSAQRSPHLPDVATMQESGVPGYEMSTWLGFATVAGTPQPVIDRLFAAAQTMMADAAVLRRLGQIGFDPILPLTPPSEMAALVRAENERWGPIIRATGARLD
ncbi:MULTISPECIES: Bug family tripartite tricarboxylate transporter substrate binding protein [Roseomonadaceae]|uniref:Tripartite tricarboxylate transporter substrate binding protein n=1 Tax=Falsiroseomonas oleicola TaxID=2801474 RepID=A0ABS6HB64_9PROT|nr:tripartite tricarboxylate transporter substrate binding protein [Roseomonas oleicola]MBU8544721.1 tripartite tricarboxylate transporter substrate binding protein [Roseomonas oleicola]